MRTNILHALLVAFILIAGWTIFTIYQDINKSQGGFNRHSVMVHGRNYLPVSSPFQLPERRLPVYKPPTSNRNNFVRQPVNSGGGSLFSGSAFDISQGSSMSTMGGFVGQNQQPNMGRTNQQDNGSAMSPGINAPMFAARPFSRRINTNVVIESPREDNLAQLSSRSSIFSNDNRFRAFGNPNDDDDFEIGGGNENLNAYNDVPIGDGLPFMLILVIGYIVVRQKIKKYNSDLDLVV